jgi:hypothetical protein
MPQYKISDFEEKAAPFKNDTKPAAWQKYDGKKPVDYGQIEADQKKPSPFSDPAAWWAALSDDQKQAVLDSAGEFVGGTAGAMAGGGTPLSIPAAGAGAVAGRSAAKLGGKALGLKPTPKTGMEELKDTAATFASNAGGEAIGAGMAFAKPIAKRILKGIVKPDADVVRLGREAGVALTPGMVSQRPTVKFAETVLENTPGAMGTIRGKTNEAIKGTEAQLRTIPKKLHPEPVERTEAGQALQNALDENQVAAKQEFYPQYEQQIAKAGKARIDAGEFRDVARQFLQPLPDRFHPFFNGDVMWKMKRVAGMPDGKEIPGGLIDTGIPELTFQEAKEIRTGLLEAERAMGKSPEAAVQRRGIPALRAALDRSIDDSLGNSSNPAYKQALKDWRATNKEYGEVQNLLGNSGGKGNATAEVIDDATNKDTLVNQLSHSPQAIREAGIATTPMFGAPENNAMGMFRRERFDNMVDSNTMKHRWNPDELIVNPDAIEKQLKRSDGLREITKPVSGELQDNLKLGKAVLGPSKLTNTSRTAIFHQMLGGGAALGGMAAGAAVGDDDMMERGRNAALGLAIGGVAAPYATARVITSPGFMKAITGAPGRFAKPILEPALGAATRGIIGMSQLPEPELPAVPSLEQPPVKPGTNRFKISDFE